MVSISMRSSVRVKGARGEDRAESKKNKQEGGNHDYKERDFFQGRTIVSMMIVRLHVLSMFIALSSFIIQYILKLAIFIDQLMDGPTHGSKRRRLVRFRRSL